ncbi:hypothetical protein F7725_027124 [Dissostichus mawsoni]|uniref:Ig-like domain-containing protein n=1 Tax=Dissostichus mawsoni TaxID=36200 RepID=A0A7J5XC12_DISMA|nr:hypothetical protein F7725_027124 [Dissostichus mawsoni]
MAQGEVRRSLSHAAQKQTSGAETLSGGGGGGPTLDGLIIKHLDLIEENLVPPPRTSGGRGVSLYSPNLLEDEESLFTLRTSWRTRSPSLLSEPPGGRGALYSPNLLEDEESLFTLRTSWRTRSLSLLSEPPGGRGVSLLSEPPGGRGVPLYSPNLLEDEESLYSRTSWRTQQEVTWQPQDHPPRQEVPPPPQEVPPPLLLPPCFQELESSATMKASTFNYARPKQFIASNLSSPAPPPLPLRLTQAPPPSQPPLLQPVLPQHGVPSSPSFLLPLLPSSVTFPPPLAPPRNSSPPSSSPSSSPPHVPSLSDVSSTFSSTRRLPPPASYAVIQDLERKLRFKEERVSNGQQGEDGPPAAGADNAATVLQSGESEEEASTTQEYKVSSFEQRLISEIEFRLERSPVEESDEDKIKHYKVFEGMPVTFSCKVTGDPKPKVYWFKDGKQISKRSEHYRISRGSDGTSSLHTANASLDDDGNYTIMAGNPQGRVSCTGRMMVQAVNQRGRSQRSAPGHMRRPHFLQAPGDLIVQEGRLCRMDCKMLVRENGVHSLVVEPVSSRDAGIYTCIASNRRGRTPSTWSSSWQMHKAPSFVEKLQNTVVSEGHPVRMECRVSGVPAPQIFWKRENESFTHTRTESGTQQQHINTASLYDNCGYLCMIIQPAMKEDAGWFTVSAKNEAGIISSTARLDVNTQWQQPLAPRMKKVRPSSSRYAALTERGLDVKAAFFPDSSPLQPGGLVESEDL